MAFPEVPALHVTLL